MSPRAVKVIRIARLITTVHSLARRRLRRPRVARARARTASVNSFYTTTCSRPTNHCERALPKPIYEALGYDEARRRLETFHSDMTRYRKLAHALGARAF
jgi:hypothetical protein